jgi:predicted dehydrogenase
MTQFTCSIVGLGRIASLLEDDPFREKPATHAGAISANPDCRLLSGFDPDPEKRSLFAERWKAARVFESLKEFWDFGKPDILHIATPPASHGYYVREAIARAIPLVICEKPLSENLREARRIASLAARSDTVLMVNHERRYSADYIRVKQIVENGKYGRLLSIHARLYMGYRRTIREMLFEDGTHLVDIIRFLSQAEILSVRSFGRPDERGGNLVAVGICRGAQVTIEAACDRDHLVFELTLGFERGRVVVGNGVYEELESSASTFYKGFNSLVKKVDTFNASTGYFSGMLSDAVDLLKKRGSDRKPVSGGYDGYMAIKTIYDILSRCKPLRTWRNTKRVPFGIDSHAPLYSSRDALFD